MMLRVLMLLALSFLVGLGACAHAPRPSNPSNKEFPVPKAVNEYHLHKFVPYTLRVRRPPVAGASASAGPGGIDYRTNPVPDAHYDCKEIAWLFHDLKLADVRKCIAKTTASSHVLYIVHRGPVPFLELEANDESPPCLKSALPVIPVPREIFFQSTEGDRLACFSSRLAIEADEVAGFKLPIDRTAVKLEFPMAVQPKDDGETQMLLMTWALTPFWDHSNETLTAHLVPDAICAACLGERTMLKPSDPEPINWPE